MHVTKKLIDKYINRYVCVYVCVCVWSLKGKDVMAGGKTRGRNKGLGTGAWTGAEEGEGVAAWSQTAPIISRAGHSY